jgi:hypothetical protein
MVDDGEYTDVDIRDVLVDALKAVEAAEIPSDLRNIAFEKAIEILTRQAPPHDRESIGGAPRPHAQVDQPSKSLINKIASKLDIPSAAIVEVYEDDGQDGLEIIVGLGKLDSSTAGATKQLALLVAGGRQLAEIEDWTSSDSIRDVCTHFGKYDASNFARVIKQMDNVFSFKGKAQQRQVKINRMGIERLKEQIRTFTGVES